MNANNAISLDTTKKHKVATLLRNKQLVASDVKCLKKSSKELLMKLCLENCLDT